MEVVSETVTSRKWPFIAINSSEHEDIINTYATIKSLDQQHENKHKMEVCEVEGAVGEVVMVKFMMSELYKSIIQGQLWMSWSF